MARKKKAANSDTNEVMIAEVAETVPESEAARHATVDQSTVAETQPQQPMTENPEVAPPEESGADRPRFRSWTINRAAGYERLSDSKRGQILVKFADRPSDEIRDVLKQAGFRYDPDYEHQGKVWHRRNDFEGRISADRIDALVREQQPEVSTRR